MGKVHMPSQKNVVYSKLQSNYIRFKYTNHLSKVKISSKTDLLASKSFPKTINFLSKVMLHDAKKADLLNHIVV